MGLRESHLCQTLSALGVTYSRSGNISGKRPTLAAWLRNNRSLYANNPVILIVGHHYVTVMGKKLVDNHCPGVAPVFLKAAPHRRKHVKSFTIIQSVAVESPWKDIPVPVVPRPPGYWAEVKKRGALLRLAGLHGIDIEDYNPGEWWVYPPEDKIPSEIDPFEAEGHLAYDAWDRARRIEKYLTMLNVVISS